MAIRKKRTVNYLSNANLMEQIKISKQRYAEALEKDPDVKPASCISDELVKMLMMLVERYSKKSNWRSYCVDEQTECLTKRGWLNIDQLTTNDEILSYDDGYLIWSDIESIFCSSYNGNMFRLTVQGMDALVTPGHKFVTDSGLKKVEFLKEKDRIILMGEALRSPNTQIHQDAFVELVGWAITEGSYYISEERNYTRITVHQNEGEYSNRIRGCLKSLDYGFSEYYRKRVVGSDSPDLVVFNFRKELCEQIIEVAPNRVPTMKFLLELTPKQRLILLNTMVDGDGWRSNGINYTQVCKDHTDSFITLCTLSGYQTSTIIRPPIGYGKKPCYTIRVYSSKRVSVVENIDFHGGKNINRNIGQPKETYPNFPTEYYEGKVWCPKTKYGCFIARRNGYVYLTGNTYLEDMRGEALLSLLNGALKFNPEVGQNPFGYLTQIVHHSFLTTLEKEKKVRKIRDDLLEQHGYNPSNTRQMENDSARLDRIERDFYEEQDHEDDKIN